MKDAVIPQFSEIVEADKVSLDADLRVGHREQYALGKRIGDKQPEQDDRRQQQYGGEPALVLECPRDRPPPRQCSVASRACRLVDRSHPVALSASPGLSCRKS